LDEKVLNRLVKLFSNHCLNSPTSSSPLDDWDLQDLKIDYVTPQGSSSQTSILSNFILIRFLSFVKTSIPLPLPNSNNTNNNNHTISILHELAKISDQRFFYESFPLARQSRRKIILHVGPTNSGKTYSALLALSKSRQGCYAGPLRLLAHEVFTRFNKGLIGQEPPRVCNLITGEEQKILDPEAGLTSCTVEMFPMNRKLDVGVIDEIQMLGDSQRGSAWTQTLVGSLCRELHLCGEESVVDLVSTICKELGDELIIKRYKRLSPLSVSRESLKGDLKKIKKGDCLVTFSRSNIFMFKRQIEAKTGLRVAVAYGGLPPEVREEQARAFNNGEYDVLVASDAVGMGLNL
jgi:ATP-dependent RNA helicase SUPV3L1/SUV3